MDKQAFLKQVARAVSQGKPYRVQTPPPQAPQRLVLSQQECIERFLSEVEQLGGTAARCRKAKEAAEQVLRWLETHQVQSVLCWEHPVLKRLGLEQALAAQGLEVWTPSRLQALEPAQRKEVLFAAGAGLTGVELAVAESGTVVLPASNEQFRTASLLPPVAVAVVQARQVVADLFDLFDHWADPQRLPPHVALVSGPSKTGDIQLQLTTGVHGPGHWYVLRWEEEERQEEN